MSEGLLVVLGLAYFCGVLGGLVAMIKGYGSVRQLGPGFVHKQKTRRLFYGLCLYLLVLSPGLNVGMVSFVVLPPVYVVWLCLAYMFKGEWVAVGYSGKIYCFLLSVVVGMHVVGGVFF